MQELAALLSQHGLLAVAIGVFLEQIGAPLPSTPLLMLAGAQAVASAGFALQSLLLATLAAMLANTLWFYAGRRLGRRVLSTLCRISISPDSCVRQNEASFARRGARTLLIAKFVPGLSVLAPPLAGALGMPLRSFMLFNLAGSLLWSATGIGVGWLFSRQIEHLLAGLGELGSAALWGVLALLLAYLAWRLWRRWRNRRELLRFERIDAAALAALLAQGPDIVVLDVRASLPGMPAPGRIPGARPLDLGRLQQTDLAQWPATAEFFTYCACPQDASAVRAAVWLRQQGRRARVLRGGIEAWVRDGQALDGG